MLMWQRQSVRRPVLPPSEQIESFPKGSKGLPPGTALTLERTPMPLYEHVFLARQDASTQQVEELTTQMTGIVEQLGGKVVKMENWGVRSLTYRMNKNRKAHFVLMNIDGPSAAVSEIERQGGVKEEVIRYITVSGEEHEEATAAVVSVATAKAVVFVAVIVTVAAIAATVVHAVPVMTLTQWLRSKNHGR